MRCMERNRVKFYYALYESKEPIIRDGLNTGDFRLIYGNPIQEYANISPARGETQIQQFGEVKDYDKVVVMDNIMHPIDEFSRLWVDTIPILDEGGALAVNDKGKILTPHDYTVKTVARSLNSVSYAISKVDVSGSERI